MSSQILSTPARSAPGKAPEEMRTFLKYINEREEHKYSVYDGGQLLYNFLLDKEGGSGPTVLWHGHLGCYEGIMKTIPTKTGRRGDGDCWARQSGWTAI